MHGALIFADFALKSVSANIETCENISMTSYVCFEWAKLHATQREFKNLRICLGVSQRQSINVVESCKTF